MSGRKKAPTRPPSKRKRAPRDPSLLEMLKEEEVAVAEFSDWTVQKHKKRRKTSLELLSCAGKIQKRALDTRVFLKTNDKLCCSPRRADGTRPALKFLFRDRSVR